MSRAVRPLETPLHSLFVVKPGYFYIGWIHLFYLASPKPMIASFRFFFVSPDFDTARETISGGGSGLIAARGD